MRPIVNPFMPTPLGMAYYLPKRFSSEAVEFDDCEQKSGTMIDYKDKYWDMLKKPGFGEIIMGDLVDQALRQISAAGQRRIRWYFSEKEAADLVHVRFYFNQYIRDRIDIQFRPFQKDDNESATLSFFHLVGAPAASRDPGRDRAKIFGHIRCVE